ncbi:hypothetical protein GDO86_007477 [Hymenochirus boettgeri]|uniref:G-protein coupled receptors family 3 profile domain-containing protein n=1 Tax=Hymenochirus boettgeri TaxID=247094 RepID=A0A8T2IZB2_9PIPI|nr:hypothetical protein GDO86_007477 [Hymenochirus boettgeri]
MACNVNAIFNFFCNTNAAWGIVLETLAAAGIVFTIILIIAFLIMIPRICEPAKRAVVPVQFIFLIGTLGVFGLTFAFITIFTPQTCPTRFFLFGVLFAICFSCLLAHASKLVRLVRGGQGISWWVMLLIVFAFSLVQIVIAILYVSLVLGRNGCATRSNQLNRDFVLILIYVYLLMAITLLVSLFSLCGPCKYWKRHGVFIYITMFLSAGIWVAWIVMLLIGNLLLNSNAAFTWDDPTLAIALVSNGWVFLLGYFLPELCMMSRSEEGCQKDCVAVQPRLLRQTIGVDNRVFSQENINQGETSSGRSSPAPSQINTIPMRDFSIPRPQQRQNPYLHYRSHDLTNM